VGRELGECTRAHGKGTYTLTIEKVDGDKVYGRVETVGGRPGTHKFQFRGVLDGNHLKYGCNSKVNLEITGLQMRGRSAGSAPWNISLTKKQKPHRGSSKRREDRVAGSSVAH
jgi:hypothetical protein